MKNSFLMVGLIGLMTPAVYALEKCNLILGAEAAERSTAIYSEVESCLKNENFVKKMKFECSNDEEDALLEAGKTLPRGFVMQVNQFWPRPLSISTGDGDLVEAGNLKPSQMVKKNPDGKIIRLSSFKALKGGFKSATLYVEIEPKSIASNYPRVRSKNGIDNYLKSTFKAVVDVDGHRSLMTCNLRGGMVTKRDL